MNGTTKTKMLQETSLSDLSLSTPEHQKQSSMAEEEDELQQQTPKSPFWIQTTTHLSRMQRYRHRLSSLFFNSFVLIIILLLLFALFSIVFIIPSLSSNVFRPNFVKRSWDSINSVLVFIGLVFGFLSRNIINDEKLNNGFDDRRKIEIEASAGAPIIYDDDVQDDELMMDSAIGLRRKRTSVSYPDLRELSPPWNHRAGDPWRFSDDTHLNYYQKVYTPVTPLPRLVTPEEGLYFPSPPPLLPSPPQTAGKKKKKRRQRDRSVDNLDNLLHRSQPPMVKLTPPPPPPPPPPPIARRNFFESKKQNPKKFISIKLPPSPSAPPPPPPPPPPTITRLAPFVTDKPGSLMTTSFNGIDDSSSGGESPMKRIPPPPPLPPFKMPDWKFAVEGDFVRLQSTLSSRSGSPDGDESRSPSSDVDTAATAVAVFCANPDVDTKADNFIAKFRAGLKLERMSKLGPGPGLGPSYI